MAYNGEIGGVGNPKEGPGASPEAMRLTVVEVAVGRLMVAEQQGNPVDTVA